MPTETTSMFGGFPLTERRQHTEDGRYRIRMYGSGELAQIVDAETGSPLRHASDVARCLAWIAGYNRGLASFEREVARYTPT